jgi:myo-inositol 2-dehydrogenase/D-chiro-inositol 1-dehydrogenase
VEVPGRSCPLAYQYQPEALAQPAQLEADTLYVVGGLYGNPAALQALLERADRAEMEHFVTTIETGSTPSPGFTDGRAALVLADAANESLRTGTTVKVVGA